VSSGSTYTGNWLAGQRSGQGKIEWPNGDVYDGHWKADRMNGFGTLSLHDGTRYTGGWLDDMFDGSGELVWSGGKYVGEWKADNRHGQGCHTLANGDSYTGSWKDDMVWFTCNTRLAYSPRRMRLTSYHSTPLHSNSIQCAYVLLQRDGQGSFVSGDGTHRYEGTWDRNMMHGNGVLELRGNLTYQGEFVANKVSVVNRSPTAATAATVAVVDTLSAWHASETRLWQAHVRLWWRLRRALEQRS